jgi:hypothetical protein
MQGIEQGLNQLLLALLCVSVLGNVKTAAARTLESNLCCNNKGIPPSLLQANHYPKGLLRHKLGLVVAKQPAS